MEISATYEYGGLTVFIFSSPLSEYIVFSLICRAATVATGSGALFVLLLIASDFSSARRISLSHEFWYTAGSGDCSEICVATGMVFIMHNCRKCLNIQECKEYSEETGIIYKTCAQYCMTSSTRAEYEYNSSGIPAGGAVVNIHTPQRKFQITTESTESLKVDQNNGCSRYCYHMRIRIVQVEWPHFQ